MVPTLLTAAVLAASTTAAAPAREPDVPLPFWVCLTYREDVQGPEHVRVKTIEVGGFTDEQDAHLRARDIRDHGYDEPVPGETALKYDYLPKPPHPAIVKVTVEKFDYDHPVEVCRPDALRQRSPGRD